MNEWMNEWNKGDHIWTEDNKTPWPKDYDQSNYASSLQWHELLLKYLLKFAVQAFPVDWGLWKQNLLLSFFICMIICHINVYKS